MRQLGILIFLFYLKKINPSQKLSLTDAFLQSPPQPARLAGSSQEMSGQPDEKILLDDLEGANAGGLSSSWLIFICGLQQEVAKIIHGK